MMNRYCCILLASLCMAISACSSDNRPFTAVYTSRNDVTVTYQGKDFRLNRFQRDPSVPFQYAFEGDGDLNLVIDGREYEVESPFDVDAKKKKTKKPSTEKKKK